MATPCGTERKSYNKYSLTFNLSYDGIIHIRSKGLKRKHAYSQPQFHAAPPILLTTLAYLTQIVSEKLLDISKTYSIDSGASHYTIFCVF